MADDVVQLDLTLTVKEVPQANSLPLFIRLMEEIHRGAVTVSALAASLSVEERTVHYYVDFGRWLRMLTVPEPGAVAFTETGKSFATSEPARGRLFASAMFSRKLIQSIQALKRESRNADDLETIDTRTACFRAIAALTDLSEVTAQRRASGLAQMLEAAHHPARIDWSTGQPRPEFRRKLEYDGRSFLTALAARQFSGHRELRIGFPLQVRAFVESDGRGMRAKIWRRASFDSADGNATWFGAVPVTASTVELAGRGGRDLRRFLVSVAPYVSLFVAALTCRGPHGRSARLTHDMYGLRLWDHDREIGTPREVVERIARQAGLVCTLGLPAELSHGEPHLVEPGTDADLVETLAAAGFIRRRDTTYDTAPGIDAELREAHEDSASVADLLAPARDAFRAILRG